MKKLVSLLLTLAMIFTISSPAFAVNTQSENVPDSTDLYEVVVDINGNPTSIRYGVDENNYLAYAEFEEDYIEVVGDEIYLNGELVATITREIVYADPNAIEPYTYWVYQDTCPYGSFSDYVSLLKEVNHNITFEKAIKNLSASALLAILCAMVPFKTPVQAETVFRTVANTICAVAVSYALEDKVYAVEKIYSHKTVPSAFHQNYFHFYSDATHTEYIESALSYSCWT